MDQEIRKVKITMDGIKQDISSKKELVSFILLTIFLPFWVFCFVQVFLHTSTSEFVFFLWADLIMFGLFILAYFSFIHSALYKFIQLKKGNITIKKDEIVDIKETYGRNGVAFYDYLFASRIATGKTTKNIVFSTSNRTKLYEWSVNEMNGNWVGKVGDEYYLVFLGKSKKPCMIYNTRYFYIEGE